MKYNSIKSLDSKLSSRYKQVDTPAPQAPVESKAKEVLKTLGDKIEESGKQEVTENIDRSNMSIEQVLKAIKDKERARSSNLKRL